MIRRDLTFPRSRRSATAGPIQIVATASSGDGRAALTAQRMCSLLADRGHPAQARCFANLAEFREWGRQCAMAFSHLVCVGGDSTQSAGAEAAMRAGVPLIPVPTGFGNVFARTFGHDDRPPGIVDLIERGIRCRVDVGRVGPQVFLCHRSYGFLDDIQSAVERRRPPRGRLDRHLAYYAMAFQTLRDTPLASIQVDVDGAPVATGAALVTVANVETYRGFLTLTPGASPFDGLLDVCALAHASKGRLLAHLIALFLGLPGCWRGVGRWRGSRVAVSVRGRPREDLRVVAGALTVVAPPAAAETLLPRGGARDQVVGRASTAHPRERMATRTIRPTATHTA